MLSRELLQLFSRSSRIRTDDPMRPRHMLYQAELHSDCPSLVRRHVKLGFIDIPEEILSLHPVS